MNIRTFESPRPEIREERDHLDSYARGIRNESRSKTCELLNPGMRYLHCKDGCRNQFVRWNVCRFHRRVSLFSFILISPSRFNGRGLRTIPFWSYRSCMQFIHAYFLGFPFLKSNGLTRIYLLFFSKCCSVSRQHP